jgi:hypothetical protein
VHIHVSATPDLITVYGSAGSVLVALLSATPVLETLRWTSPGHCPNYSDLDHLALEALISSNLKQLFLRHISDKVDVPYTSVLDSGICSWHLEGFVIEGYIGDGVLLSHILAASSSSLKRLWVEDAYTDSYWGIPTFSPLYSHRKYQLPQLREFTSCSSSRDEPWRVAASVSMVVHSTSPHLEMLKLAFLAADVWVSFSSEQSTFPSVRRLSLIGLPDEVDTGLVSFLEQNRHVQQFGHLRTLWG